MDIERFEISAHLLANRCDPDSLGFETTEEVSPLAGMIGQDRALRSLELALGLDGSGYNVFISGQPGTGRNTALKRYVQQAAYQRPIPPDWGYVYNFKDPTQPIPISLPCGMMRDLVADMNELIESVRRDVPRAFETEDYTKRMDAAMQVIESQRNEMLAEMQKAAENSGFALRSTSAGLTPIPMRNGKPLSESGYAAMSEAERERLQDSGRRLQQEINRVLSEIRRLGKEAAEEAREVDREIVLFTLTPIVDELQEKYADYTEVVAYLDEVEADMVDHLDMLKPKDPSPGPKLHNSGHEDKFIRYRVNDLVDNTVCEYAPVVVEHIPTYYNLFGRIDYQNSMGTFSTDHTMIKSGAFHEANGGFLILQARELLGNPPSWQTLKTTLRSGEIRIENMGERVSPLPSTTLRPKPIPANVKVIIVGTPDVLQALQLLDEDFKRYFKVTAYFDVVMDRTSENEARYAEFIAGRCRESGLKPVERSGVARIIDHSSRVAEHQQKLTTRFVDVADIMVEANHWATLGESETITDEHVLKAIEQRRYRAGLSQENMVGLIEEGTIRISTEGKAIGQVNGLAVLVQGEVRFGKPNRVTAIVSLGRGQLINIERETKLSGKIHDKGFLILSGYLRGKYGSDKPLSLNASIGFEQSYSEVDGDSASSTELYALLSAISGIPIDQGIAVTGAVNQYGEVQAVGGATEKIEGYFEICRAMGLTGEQGVIVPRDNVKHIFLSDEVIQAVKEKRFHIYAVSTVDEGIEVLTGIPAGDQLPDGRFPEGTVHHSIDLRLNRMTESAGQFGWHGIATPEDVSVDGPI